MNQEAKPRDLSEFVDDLVRIGVAELVSRLAAPEDQARASMARIADGIVTEYARRSMYIPAGFGSRNSLIWEKYQEHGPSVNGQPGGTPFSNARVSELAVEYKLTERQIYNIIAAMRTAEFARHQGHLPGFDQLG